MNENRYGNLLDKYMDDKNNNSNRIMDNFKRRKKAEAEAEDRYGYLLDNVGNRPTIYDKMMDVQNAMRESKRREAEKEEVRKREIKAERERREQELQAHIDKNNAFVEDYLAKKKAEQEATQKAIEEKKKKEDEQAEIYRNIEKFMEISPRTAEVYADICANKLKKF